MDILGKGYLIRIKKSSSGQPFSCFKANRREDFFTHVGWLPKKKRCQAGSGGGGPLWLMKPLHLTSVGDRWRTRWSTQSTPQRTETQVVCDHSRSPQWAAGPTGRGEGRPEGGPVGGTLLVRDGGRPRPSVQGPFIAIRGNTMGTLF